MDRFMKVVNRLLWVIFLGMGIYLLAAGSSHFWTGSVQELLVKGCQALERAAWQGAARSLYPGLFIGYKETDTQSLEDWLHRVGIVDASAYKIVKSGRKQSGTGECSYL